MGEYNQQVRTISIQENYRDNIGNNWARSTPDFGMVSWISDRIRGFD